MELRGLAGKKVLITGASKGQGFSHAKAFAEAGCDIAALDSMTRSLARALAPAIRVVSVSPGWVDGAYASSMPRSVIDEQLARTPLRRLATPDDVGDAVYAAVALLTDTTGVALAVDGGRPLGA